MSSVDQASKNPEFAEVILWGNVIGVVAWDPNRQVADFEYTPEFQQSGIEIAPRTMPLGSRIYSFPELNRQTYYGLPGLLADSLPDKFGNLLIDQWLVRQGRGIDSFSPVDRLCYVGKRGMGALEFRPTLYREKDHSSKLEISELVELANAALQQKANLETKIGSDQKSAMAAMEDILQVGTSAGGARAKAVIAWNKTTNEIRSGQISAPTDFTYWLLKFDGVSENRDKELADPKGFGKIEYAYYLMATAAGINMNPSELLHENDRSHFVTKRFDRTDSGEKVMMQSLCAMGHFDFNQAGAYSYEQAFTVAEQLDLSTEELRQLYRRMVFNVLARNQDDHTKNIAFLMDRRGEWSLAPAFDVTYSYNPRGAWTHQHQMSINGNRDDIIADDLAAVAKRFRRIGKQHGAAIVAEVHSAMTEWLDFADQANIEEKWARQIQDNHRLG